MKWKPPDEVVGEQVAAQPHGLQNVISDLLQQPAVLCTRLGVGVATFVCAKLQQNCGWTEYMKRKQAAGQKPETQVPTI